VTYFADFTLSDNAPYYVMNPPIFICWILAYFEET